jgi:fatty acid desaturase
VVPDNNDVFRNARTTYASWWVRALVAPYWVNYHVDHHLLFYVPCYNLPKLHAILMRGPHAASMEVQRGYLSVLRLATTKPAAEDRPGVIVSNVRRLRNGTQVDEDQLFSGF